MVKKFYSRKDILEIVTAVILVSALIYSIASFLLLLSNCYSLLTSHSPLTGSDAIQHAGVCIFIGTPALIYFLKFRNMSSPHSLTFSILCIIGIFITIFAVTPVADNYRNIQIEEYLNPANCTETVFWADDSPVYHYDSSCNQFGKEDHFNGSIEEAESDGAIYPCPDCFEVWVEQRQNELESSQ